MNKEIFADGVINMSLRNGMVRIEFGSLSAKGVKDDGSPDFFNRSQLLLTPKAFVETLESMEAMLGKLKEAGVVREKGVQERRSGPARDQDKEISVAKEG